MSASGSPASEPVRRNVRTVLTLLVFAGLFQVGAWAFLPRNQWSAGGILLLCAAFTFLRAATRVAKAGASSAGLPGALAGTALSVLSVALVVAS